MKIKFTGIILILSFCFLTSIKGYTQYCATLMDNSYEYITNVTFAGINNSTGASSGYGPGNYTALGPAIVQNGDTYTISVSIASDGSEYVSAFIDWNQNGVLNDAGEAYHIVASTSSTGPHTYSITVPSTALPGETRMRVVLKWNSTPTPCLSGYEYGEVEDYTVKVISCSTPEELQVDSVVTTNAYLSWEVMEDVLSSEIIYGLEGFELTDDHITITTTNNTLVLEDLHLATTYDVYYKSVCAVSESDLVGPLKVITPCITPQITSIDLPIFCEGTIQTINVTTQHPTFIYWYDNPEEDCECEPIHIGNSFTTPMLTSSTQYYIQLKSFLGNCNLDSTIIIPVTISPKPNIDLEPLYRICLDEAVTLNSGVDGVLTYWSTGEYTNSIIVEDTGSYTVYKVSADECSDSMTTLVEYKEFAKADGFNFVPLFEESLGKIQFEVNNPENILELSWNFGDGSPLSHELSPIHFFETPGFYNVSLFITNFCSDTTFSLPIHVDHSNNIQNYNKDIVINIYPNPVYNLLNLILTDGKIEQIRIINTLGSVMETKAIHNNKATLEIEHLAQGVYQLEISTSKGIIMKQFAKY